MNDDEWDAALRTFGGSIFMSRQWLHAHRAGGAEPVFFRLFDGDACVGVCAGVARWGRLRLLGTLRTLTLFTSPVVRDDDRELTDAAVREIVAWSSSRGAAWLEAGSYNARVSPSCLASLGFDVVSRLEFVFDLTAGEEALWNGLSKNRRKKIRKGDRAGVEVEVANSREALESLFELSAESMSRHGTSGASRDALMSKLPLLQAGLARLYLARLEGKTVSALLVTEYEGTAYSIYSGNCREGLAAEAASVVLWRSVLDVLERGLSTYVIGGVKEAARERDDPEHGLYEFKKDFGGEERQCLGGAVTGLGPLATRVLSRLNR